MQFKEIIGQDAVKQRLINSVKENRVSHAQLFLGQEGSGNLPLAVAYAQYLCCDNKGAHDSCGHCSSCIKMNKLVHPDVTFTYSTNLARTDQQIVRIEWDLSKRWSVVALRDENGVFGVDFQVRKRFK